MMLALGVALLWRVNSPIQVVSDNAAETNRALADAIQLAPAEIAGFERTEPHWRNLHEDGSVEEGSMYKAKRGIIPTSAAEPNIQLDFYRAYNNRHNGQLCYLLQGETLLWTRRQAVQDPKQKTHVLLGLTQSDRQLRLTAATECYAQGCDEMSLGSEWAFNSLPGAPLSKDKSELGIHDRGRGIVPMSVVMTTQFDEAHRAEAEQALLTQMNLFLEAFDFEPVKRLAELQN